MDKNDWFYQHHFFLKKMVVWEFQAKIPNSSPPKKWMGFATLEISTVAGCDHFQVLCFGGPKEKLLGLAACSNQTTLKLKLEAAPASHQSVGNCTC